MESDSFSPYIEDRVQLLGEQLLKGIEGETHPPGWLDSLITRAIQDEAFRVQTLRFVDVMPMLTTDAELVVHLKEYFDGIELPWPSISEWGLRHSDSPWAIRIAAPLVRTTLRGLSRRFMGGRNIQQSMDTIVRLHDQGMLYSLDLLGEAVISEQEADHYQQAYLDLLSSLEHADRATRVTGQHNISIKLTSLYSQINPLDPEGSVAGIGQRLRPILHAARDSNTRVTIDMEQYDMQHIVLQCFMSIMMEPELRDWPDVGIALQTYLRNAGETLQQLYDWVLQRGTPIQCRLVRGAYWDYETVIARQHGWPVPVWEHKAQTDAEFESCMKQLFAEHHLIKPAVATHNLRSVAYALALAEQHNLGADDFEFQMLYGMADNLKTTLVKDGHQVRVYVPYGEPLPGMAYLVRRLLENTSGQTILDAGMAQAAPGTDCLERPMPHIPEQPPPDHGGFHNLPLFRFTDAAERTAMHSAIGEVESQLGKFYPLIIDGTEVDCDARIVSSNPARPAEVVGTVAAAGEAEASHALAAAQSALPGWRALPARQRATVLRNIAAALISERRQFAAWQVLEAGKSWREADADVCETVDFLHYYAEQAERLAASDIVELNGEHNTLRVRPRGIGLVIAPWNFPLAILTGMLSATIVTGNTAILKPSSLTPVIAARFVRLMHATGLPPGVVNFLPGPGGEVGAWLAAHPDIQLIAFTGSREVGTRLLALGAEIGDGQAHIKRVIAEMGGKNAIIIDDDADLDDAIPGVIQSAFGFQGQKCSAASRVIVVGDIHDDVVERLCAATASLTVGDPRQPGNSLGPVIDAVARQRILDTITRGRDSATLVSDARSDLPAEGHYLSPAIFTDVAPDDPLAQEEIFGPVLAVLRADNFEHALELANGTRYALTGGVYSRRPGHLARARTAFEVGNLYLNRKITGALVARQPFGGFRMSGTGNKAGGADYLRQFVEARCITENTMRRGFAPEVGDDEEA